MKNLKILRSSVPMNTKVLCNLMNADSFRIIGNQFMNFIKAISQNRSLIFYMLCIRKMSRNAL